MLKKDLLAIEETKDTEDVEEVDHTQLTSCTHFGRKQPGSYADK